MLENQFICLKQFLCLVIKFWDHLPYWIISIFLPKSGVDYLQIKPNFAKRPSFTVKRINRVLAAVWHQTPSVDSRPLSEVAL